MCILVDAYQCVQYKDLFNSCFISTATKPEPTFNKAVIVIMGSLFWGDLRTTW